MNKNQLSIIIISFNTQNQLRECLVSVQNTLGSIPAKIIVIDNASQDNSVEMIKKEFPNVKIVENKKNIGFAKAVNQGIKFTQDSDYILLLNPDTQIKNQAIQKLIERAEKDPTIGIMGPKILHPTNIIQPSFGNFPTLWSVFLFETGLYKFFSGGKVIHPNQSPPLYQKSHPVDWLTGACFLIKKEVLRKIGNLEEKFFFGYEDMDYCLRAKKAGFSSFFEPEAEVIHHHRASAKKVPFKTARFETKSLYAYFRKHHNFIEFLLLWLMLTALIPFRFALLLFKNKQKALAEIARLTVSPWS